jgi:hypothetical protein
MAENPLTYMFEPVQLVDRAKAYSTCIGGRRYAVAHQTPGTTIVGQTSFVATTPTFLINQANSNGRRIVLSNFALCQDGTPAGGVINILVAIDPADRYSSGGTAITPQATMADSDYAAGCSFRYNPTATSPSTARILYQWTQPVWAGAVFNPDLQDGVAIGQTGSILIYTWAATTAPTWTIGGFDILEEN